MEIKLKGVANRLDLYVNGVKTGIYDMDHEKITLFKELDLDELKQGLYEYFIYDCLIDGEDANRHLNEINFEYELYEL